MDPCFLDNGTVRIGLDKGSGGSVFFFGESATRRNLLNHCDRGRFIQQSYYGTADGSLWGGQPWRWNPVQGGGYRGEPAKVLQLKQTPASLEVKSRPKHWATGEDLPETEMEEIITLEGPVARLQFRFSYRGEKDHPPTHQEMPAVFVDYALPTLVYYEGDRPWTGGALTRRVPGWPNEYAKRTEDWAAYVDDKNWGIGVYTPGTPEMTCYRFKGTSGPEGGGCSYFSPIRTSAIRKGTTIAYEVYLTIGTVDEIRARFKAIHHALQKKERKESR